MSRVKANRVSIEMLAKCFIWFRLHTYDFCRPLLATQRKLPLKSPERTAGGGIFVRSALLCKGRFGATLWRSSGRQLQRSLFLALIRLVFTRFRLHWLFAGALCLCSSAWSGTVLDNRALLGMSLEEVTAIVADAQPVRSPRRLPSGALGSLRVPDALCEGAHFEQTLFFARQKLTQMDLVLLNPASGPGAEEALAQAQAALLQSLRAKLGPELAAFGATPGAVADTASWVSADADVMLFRSGRPGHSSLRVVIKQRQLVDAGEL
jgi:hypothetical protein